MAQWKAYSQINADDISSFDSFYFDVTDEQYKELSDAVANNIPINETDCFDEVEELAEKAVDYQSVIDYWPGIESEDDLFLYELHIDDPGDMKRLKQQFVGRPIEEGDIYTIEEDYDRYVTYEIEVTAENGLITDLSIEYLSAIESFGFRRNIDSEQAYPNYELLADELEQQIFG